jgi:hypothetical protein
MVIFDIIILSSYEQDNSNHLNTNFYNVLILIFVIFHCFEIFFISNENISLLFVMIIILIICHFNLFRYFIDTNIIAQLKNYFYLSYT